MNRETRFEGSDTLIVVDRPNRKRQIIIAAVLIVAALAIAFFMFGSGKDEPAQQANAAGGAGGGGRGGQIPSVSVIVPGQSNVARTITASGALAARRDQPVGVAGEGGLVRAVLVDAGSWVRQGQVLATIDRSVQSQTAAQLAASIQVARADAALAQNEYDRSAALVGRGFVSKADLDRKKAARDAANARVRVAQAQFGAARAQIGRLDIRAPTSGLILSRSVEVGQIVSGGAGGLFRLAKGGEMEMRAQMSQQDLAAMRVGLPASVTPLGSTTAPMLPQSAVLSDENGNYVYIVNSKNLVERRPIKIGEVSAAGVTVAEGLSGQENVVLSAGPFLNPGQKVAPRRQAAR
jgi:multidrug efflux pump subunit AcrA (membrane-fusion protein)